MTAYVVNDRTGEVHDADCPRVKVIASKSDWDPAKAQLTPGVTACRFCMPRGLPLRQAPAGPTDQDRLAAVATVLEEYAVDYPHGRSRLYYAVWQALNPGQQHPEVQPLDLTIRTGEAVDQEARPLGWTFREGRKVSDG